MPPKNQKLSPVLYDYLRRYQEDPTSRVFAPLAEAYRKAGLIDEAIEISREGLKIHPHFVGGRVALARALFDRQKYSEVISELSQMIQDAPDNLVAQRLLAESHLMLGNIADALGSFKMILYFYPADHETAKMVQELETQAYERGALVLRTDSQTQRGADGFQVGTAGTLISEDPELKKKEWIRRVELLQDLMLRVERYRHSVHLQQAG